MSEIEQQTIETPPVGAEAPPSVEPLAPPEPETEPEPIGRPDEPQPDEPLTDAEQGVGVAPTQPGDAGEGNPGTAFQTTEEIEAAQADTDDDGDGDGA